MTLGWLAVLVIGVALAQGLFLAWGLRHLSRRLRNIHRDIDTLIVEVVEGRTDLHTRHDGADHSLMSLHAKVKAVHDKHQYGKRGPVK